MRKVIVIGCPGSGKSTFSKKLHKAIGIPLFHLDMLYWNSDKTVVEKNIFEERLKNILVQEEWIIDGNYGTTMELRLQACDTVFFLDYAVNVCLEGIEKRKGKARTDIPWIEEMDDEKDEEFISFIKNYNSIDRLVIMNFLDKYNMKNIIIFKNRKDSQEYLEKMNI
ncbi:MAG: adenylate kinase [Clostridium sp.]